jgi:hypothetical protein
VNLILKFISYFTKITYIKKIDECPAHSPVTIMCTLRSEASIRAALSEPTMPATR